MRGNSLKTGCLTNKLELDMRRKFHLLTVVCIVLSLFTNCSDDNKEEPVEIPTNITVDKGSVSVDSPATVETIALSTNKDWVARTEASWLSVNPSSGKADSNLSVEISISSNEQTEQREAVITFTADDKREDVRVIQKGKIITKGIDIADSKFKQYLVENFDADGDGEISTEEAESVKEINCSGLEIESLSGIEYFVNLEILNCNSNSLKRIDIGKNLLLSALNCDNNQIDSLGVTVNTALKILSCSSNNLTNLDISKNAALTALNCSNNQLNSLEISKNLMLEVFDCSNNELTVLDVSSNLLLKNLDCRENKTLEKLILAKGQSITDLSYDKDITVIEYFTVGEKNINIPDAIFKAYLVENFDKDKDGEISESEALEIKVIRCYNMGIYTLEGISSFVNLEILVCSGNNMTSIDVGKNLKLKELDCAGNDLRYLDVSKNISLEILYCYNCKLSSLDVTTNVNLVELACSSNGYSILDVSKNRKLQRLLCQGTNLTRLDLRFNQELKILNCSNNARLSYILLEEGQAIETIYIDTPPTDVLFPNYVTFNDTEFLKYMIENFDTDKDGKISGEEALSVKQIDCTGLGISSIAGIERFTNLTSLACAGNKLTSIDISSNKALVSLRCDSNQISNLDVSNNTLLETLSISKNNISSISLSNNNNLVNFICNNNNIIGLALSNNTKLKKLLCQNNNLNMFLYLDNNQALDSLNCADNSRLKIVYLRNGQTINDIIKDKETDIRYIEDSMDKLINIPDAIFKTYLLSRFDTDKNGEIFESEALKITDLQCSSLGISSLSGIEHFPNLNSLICDNNNLTSLPISFNTKLRTINCYDNNITSLDVSNCVELQRLICGSNNISSLNLTKNTILLHIDCSYNKISTLNVRNCPLLSAVICTGNPSSVEVFLNNSQNPSVTGGHKVYPSVSDVLFDDAIFESFIIDHYDTNRDGAISIAEAEAVTGKMDLRGYGVRSLKGLEKFVNLRQLDFSDNLITGALNLSANVKLTNIVCSDNSITSLNVSGCTSLLFLMCPGNKIASILDLTNNTSLMYLNCEENTSLSVVRLPLSLQGSGIEIIKDISTTVRYE